MIKSLRKKHKAKSPLLVEIKKSNILDKYILTLIALISLGLNFFIVYKTIWPHYNLEIMNQGLNYDTNAYSDMRYFDSLYIDFKLFNSGNKQIAIYDYEIEMIDSDNKLLFVTSEKIIFSDNLIPDEIRHYILKVSIVKGLTEEEPQATIFYKPEYSHLTPSLETHIALSKQFGIKNFVFDLANPSEMKKIMN